MGTMNLSPFELAKLLIILEEKNTTSSSVSTSTSSITDVNAIKEQPVVAKSETLNLNKKEYVNIVKDTTFITTGSLFKTSKNITIRLLKLETATEFKNFTIKIDNQVYMQGDYAYYSKIGMAYYIPDEQIYTIEITNFTSEYGVDLSIDSGLKIDFYTIIATLS